MIQQQKIIIAKENTPINDIPIDDFFISSDNELCYKKINTSTGVKIIKFNIVGVGIERKIELTIGEIPFSSIVTRINCIEIKVS